MMPGKWYKPAFGVVCGCVAMIMLSCSQALHVPAESAPIVSKINTGSPLSGVQHGLVYDTHIRIRKNEMSGLMYLRQVSDGVWRIALTAKVGQTLFDFELRPDTFIIHKCLDQLRRKIVLTYLERDLRLLVENYPNPVSIARLPAPPGFDHVRFKAVGSKGWRHLIAESATGEIAEIGYGGKSKRTTQVYFAEFIDRVPRMIKIDHRTIFNFEIQMQQVPTIREKQ